MSDRLPSRRQSGGGKHVVTRKAHQPLTGLAHVGVATAMVVGLTLVVINPSAHDTADAKSGSGPAWAAQFSRAASPDAAAVKERNQTRADIAGVATQAVSQVADVRAKAQQANLPADQLAALDSLAQRVNTLVDQVQSEPKVSRSTERAPNEPTTTPSAIPTLATDAPTASAAPSDVAQPTDASAPESAPTAADPAAAAPTDAATDPAAATDAAPASSGTTAAAPAAPSPVNVVDTAAVEAALPDVTTTEDPAAAALRAAIVALSQEVAQVDAAATAAAAAAQAAAAQAAAEAAAAQAAAQRAAWKTSLQGFANGRIPANALCPLDFAPTSRLRCDATEAANALNAAYVQAFGTSLVINDSYRSYEDQVACLRLRGSLCARPGTSNHGLGIALDIGSAGAYGTAAYHWLVANGPAFGWHNPDWARPGGSKHEPWHWEYSG